MPWFSFRIGRRTRVSTRGLSVGAGRARVGASWRGVVPKHRKRQGASRDGTDHLVADDLILDEETGAASEYLEGTAEHQAWLAGQAEDIKEAGLKAELARAKMYLGEEEVQAVETMDDDEADRALADEIASMKARDSREWVRLLASLPQSERDEMRRIEKKYGL